MKATATVAALALLASVQAANAHHVDQGDDVPNLDATPTWHRVASTGGNTGRRFYFRSGGFDPLTYDVELRWEHELHGDVCARVFDSVRKHRGSVRSFSLRISDELELDDAEYGFCGSGASTGPLHVGWRDGVVHYFRVRGVMRDDEGTVTGATYWSTWIEMVGVGLPQVVASETTEPHMHALHSDLVALEARIAELEERIATIEAAQ